MKLDYHEAGAKKMNGIIGKREYKIKDPEAFSELRRKKRSRGDDFRPKERMTVNKTVYMSESMVSKIKEMAVSQGTSFNRMVTDVVMAAVAKGRTVKVLEADEDDPHMMIVKKTVTFRKADFDRLEGFVEMHGTNLSRMIKSIVAESL